LEWITELDNGVINVGVIVVKNEYWSAYFDNSVIKFAQKSIENKMTLKGVNVRIVGMLESILKRRIYKIHITSHIAHKVQRITESTMFSKLFDSKVYKQF
jgi:hypothetical protein